MPLPAFQYQPLPARSIRVIELLPARRPEDPLRCAIRAVSLDDARAAPYEALSYVWGEPAGRWPLDCAGAELLVTRNCREAMVHLRRRFAPRTLWIDAVCINQGGDDPAVEERNRQVRMIGEVYLRARRVLIWLGPGDAATSDLFRYLPIVKLMDRIQEDYPRLDKILHHTISQHFDMNGALVRRKQAQLRASMVAILENPWFERVWTIQEVAFVRKCVIIHGRSSVDWESFCLAYMAEPRLRKSARPAKDLIIPRWRLYLSLRGSSLQAIPTARFEGNEQAEFELGLLSDLRNMKATVAHDRIYSLYAVFQAMGLDLPAPDYRKDIAKVFEEVTLAYIRLRQNLNIIAITPPPDEGSGFPSWVPDWLTPGSNGAFGIWKLADFDVNTLSIAPVLTANTKDGKLGVMGKIIGTITKRICCPRIGDPGASKNQAYEELKSSCAHWRRSIDGLTAYPSGKDPRQIERVLLRSYHSDVPKSRLGTLYNWAVRDRSSAPPPLVDDATLDCLVEERKLTGTWVVIILDTGYYGTAHHLCQVGDEIAVLASLNPLVLRPQTAQREFRIVTPAYCDGGMNGELDLPTEELEEIILV
ncbi:heterokaryon incompatibility protein-domain-containing protein [Durotheca rogersii]|uniref:heterokaryon incompatibility protein-domain-containing protein n=1 Tax=Durotheca rogersii TaxID=419775 RepID=UPI002220F0C3|nr:heterokaryon incompatibility protein-domain-containing protein [Durotheca rogersii]KAI5855095.1 heterokaryon incompatibility protein-domain-containing protein [Durotheca rogersii]